MVNYTFISKNLLDPLRNARGLIFSIFIFLASNLQGALYDLSICAIFHNEERFLKDWVDFHLLMGVQHFYLYNHQSEDGYQETLEPYIEQGIVDLIDWNFSYTNIVEWNEIQCNAYNNGLDRSRFFSKWVAFIDTDEYLYSPDGIPLPEILNEYEGFGALSANWVLFGTSALYEVDPGCPLIFQLIYKTLEDHKNTVKSIVDPLKTERFINPHYPLLYPDHPQVTENKEIFHGPFSPSLSAHRVRINHYWSRDQKFFNEEKIARQTSWQNHAAKTFESKPIQLDLDICRVYLRLLLAQTMEAAQSPDNGFGGKTDNFPISKTSG